MREVCRRLRLDDMKFDIVFLAKPNILTVPFSKVCADVESAVLRIR